jgi:hypothetical protein
VSVLADPSVRQEFRKAWEDSQPGTAAAHEEGGFVLAAPDGTITIERWPHGSQDEIVVPAHPGERRGSLEIVATFHTHPNVGIDFQQEPSLTDIRAVRFDPDLRHSSYEGEYVIGGEVLYHILPSGRVEQVGDRKSLLNGF